MLRDNTERLAKIYDAIQSIPEPLDTSDATATEEFVLKDLTYYADGEKHTGTMANKTGYSAFLNEYTKSGITIPKGYHDGNGKIGLDADTVTLLNNSDNIAEGVTILGKTGTHKGYVAPKLQSKSVDITENGTTTVNNDADYDGMTAVTVNVNVPAPTPSYDTPSIEVSAGGLITASANGKSNTQQLSTQATKTVSPTESEQTAVASGVYTTGAVKVGAISSTYVGSGITRRTSTDLTASGATVTVPSGYYSSQVTKSVASGTAGTPSATKGSVSNNQISITPTVTNTTGYITGGTKNGTAVTVKASDLVSGSTDITENGNNIDVTNLKTVNVNVPTSGGGKNVQCYQGYATVTSTSYTATAVSLQVAKTGTYTVSWMGYRNTTSGTNGSQLYIDNTAYGSAQTSFVNSYGQSVKLTNVSLTAGQTITVRARARSSSYVMGVGNLTIVEN